MIVEETKPKKTQNIRIKPRARKVHISQGALLPHRLDGCEGLSPPCVAQLEKEGKNK